jgi:hypothetical protein
MPLSVEKLARRNRIVRCGLVLCLAYAATAHAGVPTFEECLEGSDFIAHAAMSRDHGMARDAFLAHLDDDLSAIRSFPPSLRWFAHDGDDERFLTEETLRVFDAPATPEAHRSQFLSACFERLAQAAPSLAARSSR